MQNKVRVGHSTTSMDYEFKIPQEYLAGLPEEVMGKIVDVIAKQYVERYGEEIMYNIDARGVAERASLIIANTVAEEVEERLFASNKKEDHDS